MKKVSKRLLAYCLIFVLFLSPPLSVCGNALTSIPMPQPVFHKGMTYVTWSKDGFASKYSDQSLLNMKNSDVGSVAIIVTWYQDSFDSTKIQATNRTPSDSSVRHAIRKAHEYGMKVMLKPHIDLIKDEGCTRSDIGFGADKDWKKWFKNYMSFITHYARMARKENVEFFCIGTELSFASQKESFWRDSVIKDVRKAFKGQITYAANWDAYRDVKFWDLLDYVGIDAYFPMSQKSNATKEEILSGWKRWLTEIETFQKRVQKPIIFTESGYCSADSASNRPWEQASKRTQPNIALQKECYKALVDTFWEKPWFYGAYWWAWKTYPKAGGENNSSFTPQNKPAMEYLKMVYSGSFEQKRTRVASSKTTRENSELLDKLAVEARKREARSSSGRGNIAFTGVLARKENGAINRR